MFAFKEVYLGRRIAVAVWIFSKQIQWSPRDHIPEVNDPGVTWTELAVSFMLATGISLPIPIQHTRWNVEALDP